MEPQPPRYPTMALSAIGLHLTALRIRQHCNHISSQCCPTRKHSSMGCCPRCAFWLASRGLLCSVGGKTMAIAILQQRVGGTIQFLIANPQFLDAQYKQTVQGEQ